MHKFTQHFASFCEKQIKLSGSVNYDYQSLSVCIIDCVYSLRAVYETVTLLVINRYATAYLSGDSKCSNETVSDLIQHVDACGGPRFFAYNILKYHQKIGGKNAISKAEVCYMLAKYFQALHIETLDDFRRFPCQDLLVI